MVGIGRQVWGGRGGGVTRVPRNGLLSLTGENFKYPHLCLSLFLVCKEVSL